MKLSSHQESHLCAKDELVLLKQTPGGVHVHGVCDAVDEVHDSRLQFLGRLCAVNGFLKHHAEGLEGELVHRVDLVEVVHDEV